MFRNVKEQAAKEKENKGLFKVRTANQWIEQAKTRPIKLAAK